MELDDFLKSLDAEPEEIEIEAVLLALPLLDYQDEARDFVLETPNGYLALDMGLGKTAVAIAEAASAKNAGLTPVLIVVPPSLRINWVREIKKFAPWLTGIVIKGKDVRPLPPVDLYIIGDMTLTFWEQALMGKVKSLIVDEAHRHKNTDAKREKGPYVVSAGRRYSIFG